MLIFKKSTSIFQIFTLLLFISFSTSIMAQEDAAVQDETLEAKKERKARSSFKLSAGANINNLSLDSGNGLESTTVVGYNLGISYKRGRFFYYEIGARFNHRPYSVAESSDGMETSFSVSAIDIPLTGGINITSFADRLIGVRVFVSAVPSFTIGEDVDELGSEKNEVNSFMFYGQGGVGIDIAFFFIEVGFNYGFSDIINVENTKTIPSQGFVNLGFRF